MIASRVVTMPLPHNREWLYYPDINLLALSPHLDEAGRQRCAEELAFEWRKDMRKRLTSVPTCPQSQPPTQPIQAPALASVTGPTDLPVSVV